MKRQSASIKGAIDDTAPEVSESVPSELLQRVVAAVILIPLALTAVYIGGWMFTLFAAVAVILMAFEWEQVTSGARVGRHTFLNVGVGLTALTAVSFGLLDIAIIIVVVGVIASFVIPRHDGIHSHWPSIGVIAVAAPAVCLLWLRETDSGMTVIVWLLLVLWATDSGAYFVGRLIGGARLAPLISPGKTWAGFFGGTASGALVGLAVSILVQDVSTVRAVSASVFVSLAGQGGDLAISAVKRRFDVKDMGTIIPGHGGVLDRLDSLLFGAIAVGVLALVFEGTFPLWP